MSHFLIDTSIWVDFFRNSASNILDEAVIRSAVVSYVTLAELMQGARNNWEKKQIVTACNLAQLDFGSPTISQLSIWLIDSYGLSHGMGVIDAIIAATALEHDLTLVTLNLKHFTCVAGLRVQLTV